ncbi:hypothetical protein IV203_000035 (plastid) [Nitzschia inconspicua]|uniref:Uncharacterized protein n=1 Tax=Nitzschia inconspicua TaxID=303405 RepID=A0A8H2SI53_9STRA|nr:hypothetical protein IV203_000035 [Nitzschia inconspicua]
MNDWIYEVDFFSLMNSTFYRFKHLLVHVMVKFKNIFSYLKKNYREIKSQPKLKRKSFLLGFTMIIVFTIRTLVLEAIAKDVPKSSPKPDSSNVAPSPTSVTMPSKEIVKGLAGAAESICALASSSGSFRIGIDFGMIVAIGILKVQGK